MGCPDIYYKQMLQIFAYRLNLETDKILAESLSKEESMDILKNNIIEWKSKTSLKNFYYLAGISAGEVSNDTFENDGCDGLNSCIGGLTLFDSFIELEDEKEEDTKMLSWSYNEGDELWQHDMFLTAEECMADAKENYGRKAGETIAIGTVYPYIVSADVDDILEYIEQDAYETCGEAAENWDISSRKIFDKEMDELQSRVAECVNDYLAVIGEKPSFYKIDDIYTVILD